MTKTELEAFLAVLQYGSISAAAERLFITQPAMSRRMKSMEEELGYSLFERGRGQRSVELTENGKEFVPVAERLVISCIMPAMRKPHRTFLTNCLPTVTRICRMTADISTMNWRSM